MIVECINDDFFVENKHGKRVRSRSKYLPKKGVLYEVVDTTYNFVEGHNRLYYMLREFPNRWFWYGFFKEVEVNIDEIKEQLEEPELA